MIIRHRINTIEALKSVPLNQGVELDIRGYGTKLLLTHDPIDESKLSEYQEFEEYLKNFNHALIVLNVKEMGYENRIIELMKKYNVKDWFFQDAEFPFIYRATRKEGMRKTSIRFSEAEPIESVSAQIDEKTGNPLLDWVWIDTNTKLPITPQVVPILSKFKTCLVCPERWGRPEDIPKYIEQLKSLNFKLDAVMTAEKYVSLWENSGVVKKE